MAGTGYVEWGLHFFSCHLSLLRSQEYEAIYVKVRAHYPLSQTSLLKSAAFELHLKPRQKICAPLGARAYP
jgi:hypothetical protein